MAIVLLGSILGTGTGDAAEVEVAADLASAYLFRGETRNDGPVFQPAVRIGSLPAGLGLGVWGNLDLHDDGDSLEKGKFSEVDFTVSLAPSFSAGGVRCEIGYIEYVYPETAADADREGFLVIELDRFLRPRGTVYYGLDGALEKSVYAEAGVSWQSEIGGDWVLHLGADLAWSAPYGTSSGFSHYQLGGSLTRGILNATLAYVGALDEAVLPDADRTAPGTAARGYDVDIVGSIGIALEF